MREQIKIVIDEIENFNWANYSLDAVGEVGKGADYARDLAFEIVAALAAANTGGEQDGN